MSGSNTTLPGIIRLGGVVRFVAMSSMVPLMSLPRLSCGTMPLRTLFSCHLICALGLVIRTFDPHMHVYPDQPSRLVGMGRDFQRKGSACSNLSSIARKQPSAAN
jgi:hypothetical protein